ncbi:MAG: outer membrane lipoprotein carrier protein LolA [Bacteroidota bacterium]
MQSKEFMLGLTDFSARFSYTIHHPNMRHKVLPRAGLLKYQKGRYAILLEDQEIYYDKAEIWTWFKADKEVSVQTLDPEEGWNLEQLFKLYEVAEKPRYLGLDTIQGASCFKIAISVDKPDLDYNRATLWIREDPKIFQQATIVDRRGTETTYTFFDHRLNPGFPASDFRFNPASHPEVLVIDERTR